MAGSEGSIGTGASDFECGLRGPVGKVLMNGLVAWAIPAAPPGWELGA